MSIEKKLLEVLRKALWGEDSFTNHIEREDVQPLIAEAKKQTVAGLVIDVLTRNNVSMDRETVMQSMLFLQQVKATNLRVNEALKCFVSLMEDAGMDYLIVKGQTIAALYPQPLLRTSGDIDFRIKDFETSRQLLAEKWDVHLPETIKEKELAFEYQRITFELHTRLVDFYSKKHQRYWNGIVENDSYTVTVDGVEVRTMSPTVYAVYVFLHLFFHFIREGVGLRQLCDWAVLMHHWEKEIDNERLAEILSNVGMTKAYRAFGCILTDSLGLKNFPFDTSKKNHRTGQKILQEIFRVGNFGKYDRKGYKGMRFKIETMMRSLRNCVRYMPLSPKELSLFIPKRIWLNIRLGKQGLV